MIQSFALTAVLLASRTAGAPAKVATFSDLCVEAESGDVAGRFVRLDQRAGAARVTFGNTEGALKAPVRARHVRFDSSTGALSFVVRTWELLHFQGRATPRTLVGRLQAAGAERMTAVRLTRVASAESPYPPCP